MAGPNPDTETGKKELKVLQERFLNIKAQMYELLAEDVVKHIQLLEDSALQSQLPTIRKFLNSKGQIQIESKEDYKDRTGMDSPDESDALALANYARYCTAKVGSLVALKPLTPRKSRPDNKSTSSQFKRIKPRFEH